MTFFHLLAGYYQTVAGGPGILCPANSYCPAEVTSAVSHDSE